MPPSRENEPSVEKIDGVYIDGQHWPSKRGASKPTLVITFDAMLEILQNETSVLDPADAAGLARAFGYYARNSEHSDQTQIDQWIAQAEDEE